MGKKFLLILALFVLTGLTCFAQGAPFPPHIMDKGDGPSKEDWNAVWKETAIGINYAGVVAPPNNGLIVEGNVGIGTSDPDFNLHVEGKVYRSDADSIVYVNTIDDFPAAVAGVITLETGKEYWLNKPIFTTNRFVIPEEGDVTIKSINIPSNPLVYLGTGDMFTGVNIAYLKFIEAIIVAPLGTVFNIDGGSETGSFVFFETAFLINVGTLGTIKGLGFYAFTVIFADIGQGIIFEDTTQVGINAAYFRDWKNEVGSVFITVQGDNLSMTFTAAFWDTLSNERVFYIDPDSTVVGGLITNNVFNDKTKIFASGSKDQTDIYWKSVANTNVPDSTVTGSLHITNNVLTTTIGAANTPTAINAIWTDGSQERFKFQDICTFTAATDTVTTTFLHGLTNGNVVSFVENGGLPTGITEYQEYYVLVQTTTTFTVEATLGGGAIDFTTDGTPPNYYRHSDGNTASGWLVYIGLEDVKISVSGWVSARMAVAVSKEIGAVIIKTDTSFAETICCRGSSASPSNTVTQSTIVTSAGQLSTNEGIKIYIENRADTVNINVLDAAIIVHKL